MVDVLEDARLLSRGVACAASIWRHMKRPMTPKVEVLYQRSWKHHNGHTGHNACVDEHTSCRGCGGSNLKESLLICPNRLNELCPRWERRPRRTYLG